MITFEESPYNMKRLVRERMVTEEHIEKTYGEGK